MEPAIREPSHPGIRIDKIPVSGTMGLVFTIASMVIFLALPLIRWFAILAIFPGLAVAAILRWTRK